ncbi:MAG TPA: NAD(P)-dependent oxidoreductase [Pseudomonas sp.]|jgi:dTDP-6-deoxy-L-talose 4-dehydrogenase (NAD+)
MRILVTGATGFVGRHLVSALLERGCDVRAVARSLEVAQGMPWFDAVEFVPGDIHSPELDIPMLTQGVHAMAHLAWPGLPDFKALFHFEHNLFADYVFIKRVVQAGVPQVMVTGTCLEYGMQYGPLGEQTLPEPVTPYGLAKNTLRLFLESLQSTQPFTLQWARLFYLHGQGQNPNSLLASLDRAIDAGESSFKMSGGEQLRDYLAIETLAGYLADMLQRPAANGVFNCCSGVPISVRALVERRLRERASSMALELGFYGYPGYEPMAFWGTTERMHQMLTQALD